MKTLTAHAFLQKIKVSPMPVVAFFGAYWCGPCANMRPALVEVESIMRDHVEFVRIDADTEVELLSVYGVDSIPALVVVRHAREIGRLVGSATRDRVLKFVRDTLNLNQGE